MSKKRGSKPSTPGTKQLLKWLDSFDKVSAAVEKHGDLQQLLKQGGGICKIEGFLPDFVAEGIHQLLEQFTEDDWNVTAADDDYTHNNIAHEFLSTKSQLLDSVFRVFTLLLPDSLFTFSAAKYCRQGHIKPHDDRAYTQVCMEDGSIQLCSRSIACIYYLTKDWTAAYGGLLIDHEAPGGPQTHVPTFNSAICFTIPRWHEVTPVVTNRPRYSIFGWFLEPGRLYELQLDPQLPTQEDLQQRHRKPQQQQLTKKKQRKRSIRAAGDEDAAAATIEQGMQQGMGAAAAANTRKKKRSKLQQASEQQQQQQQQQVPSEQQEQQQRRRPPIASTDGVAQAVQLVLPRTAAKHEAGRSKRHKKAAVGSGLRKKAGKHQHGGKTKLL